MNTLVILNAPPLAGKTHLVNSISHRHTITFSDVLKNQTHAKYKVKDVPPDHFEALKDTPLDILNGLTPREAYIHEAEVLTKPLHGLGYYGKLAADELLLKTADYDGTDNVDIVSDVGFIDEALCFLGPVSHTYDRICQIRIYKDGHDFTMDSRAYLDLTTLGMNIELFDIYNNSGGAFVETVSNIIHLR